jgi:hypothetical protein
MDLREIVCDDERWMELAQDISDFEPYGSATGVRCYDFYPAIYGIW